MLPPGRRDRRPLATRRAKRVYGAAVFLRWFAGALPMALLVLLLQSRGMSLLQIGLFLALHSGAVVLLEVPTGGLADAIGRKPVAVLSQLVSLAGLTVAVFAFEFVVFAVAALLIGAGRALASGALDAWFVDTLLAHDPSTDLQPPLATAGALQIAGLSLGALAGGAIPQWLGGGLPTDGAAIVTPLVLPVLAAIAVQAVLTVLTVVAVVEVRPEAPDAGGEHDAPTGLRAIPSLLAAAVRSARDDRIVSMILLVTVGSGLAISSLETFWQPRFATLFGGGAASAPPLAFGAILSAAFALGVVGNFASVPLARALGRRFALVALIAQGVTAAAILLLAASTSVPWALAGFWLAYLGAALAGSPLATILNEEVPSERRSSTLSVVSLAGQSGAMLGSAAFGLLAQASGIPLVWTVAGIAVLLSVVPLWIVDREREARKAAHAPSA